MFMLHVHYFGPCRTGTPGKGVAASSCPGVDCILSIINHTKFIFREEIKKIKISRGFGASEKSLFETDSDLAVTWSHWRLGETRPTWT